jgi:hypothetical protein
MDGAGALTTTILARLFIEPDAARASSTPSFHWDHLVCDRFGDLYLTGQWVMQLDAVGLGRAQSHRHLFGPTLGSPLCGRLRRIGVAQQGRSPGEIPTANAHKSAPHVRMASAAPTSVSN